jgi:hypothetical protein
VVISNDKSTSNLIPPHGGDRELKSYQNAEIVFDATVKFCWSSSFLKKAVLPRNFTVCAARLGGQSNHRCICVDCNLLSDKSKKRQDYFKNGRTDRWLLESTIFT